MADDEKLKELINELIEMIQTSIQVSPEVHQLLKKIEEQGFSLNLSLLVGIFVRDKDGQDRFFSSVGDDDAQGLFLNNPLVRGDDPEEPEEEEPPIPSQGTWTEGDIRYLESLGIRLDG